MTDSTPEQTEPISDTPPRVPPARKPTAMEVATEARELAINALEAVGSGGTATPTQGDALTAEERELLAQLPGVEGDLKELVSKIDEFADQESAALGRMERNSRELETLRSQVMRLTEQVSAPPVVTELDAITTPPVPMVYAAVLDVMRMVTELDKDGRVSGSGGNYRYRSIDAAMDAVGTAMRTVGLILATKVLDCQSRTDTVQETVKGELKNRLWTTVRITMAYTFVSPDDGSTHTVEMVGEGRDLSDKATSKAVAMAFKYALLHGLCIPIEGLPESDGSTPIVEQAVNQQPTPAQQAARLLPVEEKVRRTAAALDGLDKGGRDLPQQRELLEQIRQYIEAHDLWAQQIQDQGGYTIRALYTTKDRTIPQPPPPDDPWVDSGRAADAENQYQ